MPTVDYQPFFAHRDDALLSLALGFTSGFGIDAHGKVVPFRDATDPGDWSVLLDVSGGRRLADPKDFRNRFVFASIEIDYNVNRNLLIGFTPGLRLRWYDDYFGSPRRDLRLGWLARAEWTPDWLTRRIPGAELDFTLAYLRNSSTLPLANYTVWEGGPALVMTWRF